MANSSVSPRQSDSIRYNRTRFRIRFENSRNSRIWVSLRILKDSKDTLIKKFLSHFEFYQYLGLNIYRISLSVIIMHFFLTYKPSPIYKNEVLSEHQSIRKNLLGTKVANLHPCHAFENKYCEVGIQIVQESPGSLDLDVPNVRNLTLYGSIDWTNGHFLR